WGAAGSRAFGVSGSRPFGYNAYGAYHSGWLHGYWNGHNDAAWGWRDPYWGGWGVGMGVGVGLGVGWGLGAWGYGSSLYGMGYMPYSDPYYAPTAVAAGPYDYSQPIDTTSSPAPAATTDPAMATFDAARASFKQGDFDQALARADDALTKL